jgi:hypothetical protein
LPEEVYETARLLRNRTFFKPDSNGFHVTFNSTGDLFENDRLRLLCGFYNSIGPWTLELINRLNSCGMA